MLLFLTKPPATDDSGSLLKIIQIALRKGEQVNMLHIHDACQALISSAYVERLRKVGITLFALEADCKARGIADQIQGVTMIDYKAWVKLVMNECSKIISWI